MPAVPRSILKFGVLLATLVHGSASQAAPAPAGGSGGCEGFLLAQREESGRRVRQEKCLMQDWPAQHRNRSYVLLDVGITGTAAGYAVRSGPRSNYFTSAPEFVFLQAGNATEWLKGTIRFEAGRGTGMTVAYPENPSHWNGKMFVTVHGAGRSFAKGSLKPWGETLDPKNPLRGFSKYELLMLEKGYAVVSTRRSTDKDSGDCTVTLADGTKLEKRNLTDMPELILSFVQVAQKVLESRLHKAPNRTYLYGKSAGARVGRLINYVPGLNRNGDGRPIVDGILADDAGAGLWLPVLYRDGKDVLFQTDQQRRAFVRQIDVSHLSYVNRTGDTPPAWVSRSYQINKWHNARILVEKGLSGKHRIYEVRGVSHSGGETQSAGAPEDVAIVPLWRLMDRLIDILDEWVDRGRQPPPSRTDSNDPALRRVAGAAISLPEVACPLGVFYQYPPSLGANGADATAFAAFDGRSEEPLDGRGVYVDMNRNGYHDYRETVTAAWRRLGLLGPDGEFNRARYVACVESAADRLAADRLLSAEIAALYKKEASALVLPQQ